MASTSVCEANCPILSAYSEKLDVPTKDRYLKKVRKCGFDPYKLKKSEFKDEIKLWPAVEYPDIVNYLLVQTSWATKEQMKAYKSLEAYNFFVSGWVHSILAKELPGNKVLIYSRVKHSQRARETPLAVWILAESNGCVISAHCNCMAGLSEVCSHVGATLFALETGVRMRNSTTCTQEKSQWIMPAYVKEIPYKPVNEMDFTSAKKKFNLLHEENVTPTTLRDKPAAQLKQKTSEAEIAKFFQELSVSGTRPAILSLVPEYSDKYVPSDMCHLPPPLTSLFKAEYQQLSGEELFALAERTVIALTEDECKAIEKESRDQTKSRAWFDQRAGRITASKLRAACHTNPTAPSKSLIKQICYPEAHQFSTAATRWGCNHEKSAREDYVKSMREQHNNLTVADSGLQINPKWPHLGASPDGVVFCDCCGEGVCEVKCPFCHHNDSIDVLASNKKSCLINKDGKIQLDRNHAYYYQVQAQINIAEVEYCDFIVWTDKDLHVERICADTVFWEDKVMKATAFFKNGILPELLAKWLTKPSP